MEGLTAEYQVFCFFLFCTIGWVQESTIESVYHRRAINRGFLKGPYIPIYGVGGMFMMVCCTPFEHTPIFVFLSGLICCTVLEYFTGWLMETLFAKQFWDYSMMKFTFKNRISLISSVFWGILAMFMVYILLPITKRLCFSVNHDVIIAVDVVMMVVISIDMIITVKKQIDFENVKEKISMEKLGKIREQLSEKGEQVCAMVQRGKEDIFNIFGKRQ